MRTCRRCAEEKPLEAFRSDKNTCRGCESRRRMELAKASVEARLAIIEAYRRYRQRRAEAPKRQRPSEYEKYREKKLLRAKTKRLVKRGEIPLSQKCERCGAPNPHVHHRRYDVPDDIIWLCATCHSAEHRMTLVEIKARHDAAIRRQPDDGE